MILNLKSVRFDSIDEPKPLFVKTLWTWSDPPMHSFLQSNLILMTSVTIDMRMFVVDYDEEQINFSINHICACVVDVKKYLVQLQFMSTSLLVPHFLSFNTHIFYV